MVKHHLLGLSMLAAVSIASAAAFNAFAAEPQTPPPADDAKAALEKRLAFLPDVVAEAGGKKISKAEFIATLKLQADELLKLSDADLKGEAREQADDALDKIAISSLIAKGLSKTPAELVKEDFDSKMSALSKEEIESFQKRLEAQGKTVASYREELSGEANAQEAIAMNKWITESIDPKVKLTNEEIEQFRKSNMPLFEIPEMIVVEHILIAPKLKTGDDQDEADAAALAKASELLAKAKAGAAFGKLAEEFSDCPSGKRSQGRLGDFSKNGQMVKEFEDAAFALQPGGIAGPVKTVFGYHVIKALERKPAHQAPEEKIKAYIEFTLRQYHIDSLLKDAVQQERAALKARVNF